MNIPTRRPILLKDGKKKLLSEASIRFSTSDKRQQQGKSKLKHYFGHQCILFTLTQVYHSVALKYKFLNRLSK